MFLTSLAWSCFHSVICLLINQFVYQLITSCNHSHSHHSATYSYASVMLFNFIISVKSIAGMSKITSKCHCMFQHYSLDNFEKRMLAYINPAAKDACFNPCVYFCLSCFVLTWPYRWWFKSATGYTNYVFDKEVGV